MQGCVFDDCSGVVLSMGAGVLVRWVQGCLFDGCRGACLMGAGVRS